MSLKLGPDRQGVACALLAVLCLASGCSSEARRARHMARGEQFLGKAAYDEAIIEFRNAVRLGPTNAMANAKLGLAYLKTGNANPAFLFLRRAAQLDPGNRDVQAQLAGLYVLGNEPKEAWAIGEKLLARDPENLEVLCLLVDAAWGSNQVAEALQRLEAVAARHGERDVYHLALGNLHMRAGRPAAAEQAFKTALERNAKSPQAYQGLGLVFQSRGDLNAAVDAFGSAAALSPTNSMARVVWARAMFLQGKRAPARQILRELANQYPTYQPALAAHAELALQDHDYETCGQGLDALLKLKPDAWSGLLLKGRLHLARHENQAAVEIFRQLLKRAPKAADVRYWLGAALAGARDFAGAMRELNAALELDPGQGDARLLLCELQLLRGAPAQAIGPLEELLKKRPQLARAYVLLGTAYRMEGRTDEATDTFRKLAATAPDSPLGPFLLGLVLRGQSRTSEAERAFENSLLAAPDYAIAAAQLAAIQIQKQDVQGAVARLKQQIERAPQAPGLPFLLGAVYSRQGETNLAVAAFQHALALSPEFPGASVELARLYAAGSRTNEALAEIDRALKLSPTHAPALTIGAFLRQKTGDYAGARAAYERLLEVSPRNIVAANNLACLLADNLNDPVAAYAWASKAREWSPHDPYTADTLGWIAYKRGDYPAALSLLRESARQLEGQPEVKYHVGCALLATGDTAEALKWLRDAANAATDFTGRAEARRLLAQHDADAELPADPAALAALRATVGAAPRTAETLTRLGRIDAKLKGPREALAQYEAALQINGKYLPALLAAAAIHREAGRLDQARELAIAARDLSPRNGPALHLLGQVAYDLGQHAWAHAVLADAARCLTNDAAVRLDAGLAALALGRLDEADASFAEAARLDVGATVAGRRATLCRALAPASVRTAAVERVRAAVEAARRDWPDSLPVLAASAEIRLRSGDTAAAETELVRINQRYPSYTPAVLARLRLYADRHAGSPEALQLAMRSRELAPDNNELAEAAARVNYWGGQCDTTMRLLKQLRKDSYGLSAESLYALGLCMVRGGERTEGIVVLNEALARDPGHALAAQARAALKDAQQAPSAPSS